MNAITSLFSLTFKLIKWTLIIGVIGFVAIFIVGLYMTNKEAFNDITITEDDIAMVVGCSVILLGLVVVCKIGNAASESGAVGSLFSLIFLPITLPFKVLGAIASMGSGSSRSYSAPAAPNLTDYYFQINHIRQNGTVDSSRWNLGPFSAAHIKDAEGMLVERLVGSKYEHGKYKIAVATGGGKRYV